MHRSEWSLDNSTLTHASVTTSTPYLVTAMTPEYVSLAELAHELEAFTGERSFPYRRLYDFVLSGDLPATRQNHRWFVLRNDVELIAIILEMLTPDGRKLPNNPVAARPRDWRPSMSVTQARNALSRRKHAGNDSQSVTA